MKAREKTKRGLDEKFQNVLATSDGFEFFVKIHDFVEYIELRSALSAIILERTKANRELKISSKYDSLKQIYQGLEDAKNKSHDDLGHVRYMIIGDLNKIRNKEYSENITFWKKREVYRKSISEIYEKLSFSSAAK